MSYSDKSMQRARSQSPSDILSESSLGVKPVWKLTTNKKSQVKKRLVGSKRGNLPSAREFDIISDGGKRQKVNNPRFFVNDEGIHIAEIESEDALDYLRVKKQDG